MGLVFEVVSCTKVDYFEALWCRGCLRNRALGWIHLLEVKKIQS